MPEMEAGTEVFLRRDPGQHGVLTGRTVERDGVRHFQVNFIVNRSFYPEYELGLVDDTNTDWYSMLENGYFGTIADLKSNLLYIQLSGRLANLVYSMKTTNTDFLPYQYKPVLSFLDSPSNGLLIADEVGLGKTIEAGLIWTELRARYDARRLVVVCPAMLRDKWCDELNTRFGVNAEIVDAAGLEKELNKDKHQVADGKGLVCSLQGLRPSHNWAAGEPANSQRDSLANLMDSLASDEPVIDLLIIDEAHYLRNPETSTAKLGHMLREITEHIVLLSATPVNLREEDLFHLLNLVDPDSFSLKEIFPSVLKANEPLHKARQLALDKNSSAKEIMEHLEDAMGHAPLSDSIQLRNLIEARVSDELLSEDAERVKLANKIEKVNLLRNAVSRTRKVEVEELRVERVPITEYIELNEIEMEFYNAVTTSVRKYANQREAGAGFLLASPQRQLSSCMVAALQGLQGHQTLNAEELYEAFGEDEEDHNTAPLMVHVANEVLPNHDVQLLRNNDSKFDRFQEMITTYLNDNPNEKIIVFSFFRKTLKYLEERLREHDIASQLLMGGMDIPKQEVINNFRESASIKVLLSSEVASEGVDLQFSRILVNYDLPWNPMKIEQRIGRIDRIGQQSEKINIWNLCYADTIDQRIVQRLFERLGIFEKALGGMEEILGDEIKELQYDVLKDELTPEQEADRIDRSAIALEQIKIEKENLERNASHLIAHQGYILEKVHAADDFKKRITDSDLINYVQGYLDKFAQGHTFQTMDNENLEFEIRLPPQTATRLDNFLHRKNLHSQTRLATGTSLKCKFVNKVNREHTRGEQISQFHPLIRFISEELENNNETFYPLVSCQISSDRVPNLKKGVYTFAISLAAFEGLRTEEELDSHIIALEDGSSITANQAWDIISTIRTEGKDWITANQVEATSLQPKIDECFSELTNQFELGRDDKENENQDRVSFQIKAAQTHRDRLLLSQKELLSKYETEGRKRMIPATKGKIKKIEERFIYLQSHYSERGQLKSNLRDVCCGAFKVY